MITHYTLLPSENPEEDMLIHSCAAFSPIFTLLHSYIFSHCHFKLTHSYGVVRVAASIEYINV